MTLTTCENWPTWAQELANKYHGRRLIWALEEHGLRNPKHRMAWHGSHSPYEVLRPQPPAGIDTDGYFYIDSDAAVCLTDPDQRSAFDGGILRALINRRSLSELVRANRYWSGWFMGRNGLFWPMTTVEAVRVRQANHECSYGYMHGCLVSNLGPTTRDPRRQAEIRVLSEVSPHLIVKIPPEDLPPYLVMVDTSSFVPAYELNEVRQVFRAAQRDMRQARLDHNLTTFSGMWPAPAELL